MNSDLVVLDWACLTRETCDARRIFEFDCGDVIFENGRPGLLVRGWSPDGKRIALQNTEGSINSYAIYVVSMDGLFRGVVPNEDAWIEFLGWLVVP